MLVCHCKAVTDRAVKDSIDSGACSLRDLAECCGAGTRCGGCHLILRRLLAEAGLDPSPADYCAA